MPGVPTVFFLSDYGTQDEFVGIVHAVLAAASPGVTVIDLTHQVPAFDVRAGAGALMRSVPHLGAGVVLAVVDPGVGSGRRAVCLDVGAGDGPDGAARPRFFVGPDNGLLVAAAELIGGGQVARGVALPSGAGPSATFDGRDVFAPAAAALCRGVPLDELGSEFDPATLARLPPPTVEYGQQPDGRQSLRTEISWVDHFGNLQLAATGPIDNETVELSSAPAPAGARADLAPRPLRCIEAFADLAPSELGLLRDANGHLAVVAGRASAAEALSLAVGDMVLLTW
jgi:S-adenosyl-L-methionine hydrolase (adenosine-forming)